MIIEFPPSHIDTAIKNLLKTRDRLARRLQEVDQIIENLRQLKDPPRLTAKKPTDIALWVAKG